MDNRATQGQQHTVEEPGGDAVREQLDRLLASPFFNQSRRFPNFLRFVVEHTLAGDAEHIKERTLGIEIFGRDATYDTATDPIVRVTAAEIRKRVAQYYQDPARHQELRITLPSGSYVPQFQWPTPDEVRTARDPLPDKVDDPHPERTVRAFPAVLLRWIVAAAAVLAIVLISVFAWQRVHRSAFDAFWQPVLSSQEPVLLCIADQLEYSEFELRDAADPAKQFLLKDNLTAIVMDDLDPVVRVAGMLQSMGRQYMLQGEGATNLDQLRRAPTVFIGAFDNAWTLRLTHPLRYHFANNADMSRLWIEDSMAPGQSHWVVDRNVQMATNNYRDYAIIARFTDTNTGNMEVVIAGIARGGTRVAGEFLTNNADLSELVRAASHAGDKKNLEAVLSTQIIGGEPGTPKMEAVYFW